MFQSLWRSLACEVSGLAAARAVADVARFHRIQASPGFRQAAEWVHERLAQGGLEPRILAFPADRTTTFWGAASFQEWEAGEATLHLIEPLDEARKLADYRGLPLSLIARSLSFEGEAEVVVLEKGEEPVEYEGLDLCGKVILAQGNVQRLHDLAVVRRGAVGLLYDGMMEVEPVRPAWSLPDAVQYTSFWWQGQEPRGFGFAITPREGERLRRLAREHALRVRAHVDARLYDGALEVVEAAIPGVTGEEVILVAHLCHPQPSANDNGSGVAALLEAARALCALIARGDLTPPRRTIRFLWVPEMTGSFAYLAAHEQCIPRMVAGLNLDMVGQDQERCGGSLLFEQPPDALANFTGALLARLRECFLSEARTHGGVGGYPLFRYADTPFSGGSDHYVFSDPSVGVPMPMVIQWPDRFYHTSADTPDQVDPQMLERVGCLAAVYAYWLAQAGEAEARWLVREVSARFRQQVIATAQTAVTRADEENGPGRESLQARLEYQVGRHQEALVSVQRLAPVIVSRWRAEDAEFARAECARVTDLLPDRRCPPAPEVEGAEMVPRCRFRGPVQTAVAVARQDEAGRDRWWNLAQRVRKVCRALPVLAEYWADGHRNVAEIAVLVRQETGHEATALLVEHFSMLADLGLVDVR
ncbi:MAG TPA: DUF4910 domain-containing protein [Chloroflexi bacterium]|nr:DUF4910 domain-containing protein [Chloroflexota bacterium]